jgi:hypothetical protein
MAHSGGGTLAQSGDLGNAKLCQNHGSRHGFRSKFAVLVFFRGVLAWFLARLPGRFLDWFLEQFLDRFPAARVDCEADDPVVVSRAKPTDRSYGNERAVANDSFLTSKGLRCARFQLQKQRHRPFVAAVDKPQPRPYLCVIAPNGDSIHFAAFLAVEARLLNSHSLSGCCRVSYGAAARHGELIG